MMLSSLNKKWELKGDNGLYSLECIVLKGGNWKVTMVYIR